MPVSKKRRKKKTKPAKHGRPGKVRGPLAQCLTILDSAGAESRTFADFFEEYDEHLLAHESTAADLFSLIISDENHVELYFLLSLLLDVARRGIENDSRHGAIFVDNVHEAIETGLKTSRFSFQGAMDLVNAFQMANLPVPEALKEGLADIAGPSESMPPEDLDLDSSMNNIVRKISEAGGTAHDFFEAISSMVAAVPHEVLPGFINHLALMDGPFFETCTLYFVLSEDPELQAAAVWGLTERYKKSGLNPSTHMWLPTLRSWLPAGTSRDNIDALNRLVRRKGQPAAVRPAPTGILTVMASIADGVGAQSIGIGFEQEGQYSFALLLIKQDHGVKDAFMAPCDSLEDVMSKVLMIEEKSAGVAIEGETLRMLIENGLADGLEHGKLPPPGLLDVLEACDLLSARPQITALPVLLNFVDPENIMQQASPQSLGRWIKDSSALELLEPLTQIWFEDTEKTRQDITPGSTPEMIEKKVWAFLEGRRSLWARRFLQTAAVYRDADRLCEWRTLSASAYGLMNGRALKRVPMMERVVFSTIGAALSNLVL